MTKTEQMILSEITKRGFFNIETCYGRGAGGGRVQYGARARNAMFKLEKLGLIKITHRESWQDYNRGYSQGGTIFHVELTENA